MSRVIQQCLDGVNDWNMRIAILRKTSPCYPQVLKTCIPHPTNGAQLFLSTILRYKHDGTWYRKLFVESFIQTHYSRSPVSVNEIEMTVRTQLYTMVYMYIVHGGFDPDYPDPVDDNQQEEKERLKQHYQ